MQDIYDFNYQGVLLNILVIHLKNRRRQKRHTKFNVANYKPVAIEWKIPNVSLLDKKIEKKIKINKTSKDSKIDFFTVLVDRN